MGIICVDAAWADLKGAETAMHWGCWSCVVKHTSIYELDHKYMHTNSIVIICTQTKKKQQHVLTDNI